MFENKPLVSVIITLFNYEKYIPYCISSVLNQTYKNIEIIIVDDASTDGSFKAVKKFESSKVRIIKFEKNRGYSAAKNEGIRFSSGEYLAMLDADDMLTKNSIKNRMSALFLNDVDFVHANAYFVKDDISLKKCYKILNHKGMKFPTPYGIHAQSVLLKKQIHRDFGLYDESLRSRSDREMWWRLFGQSEKDDIKVKRYYLNDFVVYYRYHSKMMTRYRQKHKKYDQKVRALAEQVYQVRKLEGINKSNTIFLED